MELEFRFSGKLRFSDGAQYRRVTEFSADRKGIGRRYKLLGSADPEEGPGPDHVACFFFVFLGRLIICRLYVLTLSDQAQITLQLTVFLFSVKIFSWSAFAAGSEKKSVLLGPSPLSTALAEFSLE